MELSNIVFPVYRIGNTEPVQKDGVTYFAYVSDSGTSDESASIKILDDRNIDKSNLALRRMQVAAAGGQLAKLGVALFFLGDLIKLAGSKTWFIDNEGQVFNYRKSSRVKLVFRPIEQIIPIRTGGAIICVKGIPCRFKTLHVPQPEMTHAGVLLVKNSHILYGLFDQAYDTTIRMV